MFNTKEQIINNNLKQKTMGKLKAVTLVLAPFTVYISMEIHVDSPVINCQCPCDINEPLNDDFSVFKKPHVTPCSFVIMVKTMELSEDIRIAINSKHKTSKGYKAISKDLSTVNNVIKKFAKHCREPPWT